MNHTEVECACCNGNGRVKLAIALEATLQAIREGHDTSTKIIARFALAGVRVKQTAIDNRLKKLVEFGLIVHNGQAETRGCPYRYAIYRREYGE